MAQDYAAEWQRLEKMQREGKYRSALEVAETIYQRAKNDDRTDQQLKALYHRLTYLQQLEDFNSQQPFDILRATLTEAEDPAFQALTEHVLGRMLYQFAGNNSRSMSDRTTGVDEKADWDKPLTEWSSETLYRTGTEYLLSAVEKARASKAKLSALPAIVKMGENLEARVPTLYDALVHTTLDELSTGYASLPEPIYAFTPGAELLLQPLDGFLRAKVKTEDKDGLNYRTFRLYQRLLSDQLSENRKAALVFANLKRLQWGHQLSGDDEAYNQALKDFYQMARDYPDAGSILLTRADLLQHNDALDTNDRAGDERFNLVRTLALLEKITREYPDSEAAQSAASRILSIKTPSLRVMTEEFMLRDQPNLVGLSYQNVDKVYYKVINSLFRPSPNNRYIDPAEFKSMARKTARLEGQLDLVANDDYKNHVTEFILADLPSGQYDLLVSSDPSFDYKQGVVCHKKIAVTRLAILRLDNGESMNKGLVVDRVTGEAIGGVSVDLYQSYGYNNDDLGAPIKLQSDANGYVDFPAPQQRFRSALVVLSKGDDKSAQNLYLGRERNHRSSFKQTRFFLDRGLYRPGQTVYLKGISLSYDSKQEPTLLKQTEQTIWLYDANGQEVAKKEVKTDMYGAFNLEFVLPEGGLNGRFSLNSSLGGGTSFRVEAYKRPRFEVAFDPYDKPVESGDAVTVTGKALGFAGPPVSDGKVTYRVVREEVNYWFYYRGGGGSGEVDAVLATGTTTTDDEGKFEISFEAKVPQNKLPYWRRPSYVFRVYADVADVTGETHAADQTINLRSKGARLSVTVPNLVDRVGKTTAEMSFTYEGVDTTGPAQTATVTFLPIRHPDPYTINRYWQIPDRPLINRQEFDARFPNYAYGKTADQNDWPLRRDVKLSTKPLSFTLGKDKTLSFPTNQLPVGYYRVVVDYPDGNGGTAQAFAHFGVYDAATGQLPEGENDLLQVEEQTVKPGETAKLHFLTAKPLPLVLSAWQSRGTQMKQGRDKVVQQKTFEHQVTNADRGGLSLSLAYVRDNRFFDVQRKFTVPWPTKELKLEYTSFRDKLRPGEAEEWTIKVSDHTGAPIAAQLLASMYDASLDAIAAYSWQDELNFYSTSFSGKDAFNSNNFGHGNAYGRYEDRRPKGKRKNYQLPRLDFGPLNFYGRFGRTLHYREMTMSMEVRTEAAEYDNAAPPPPPPPKAAPGGFEGELTGMSNKDMSYGGDDESASNESGEVQLRENLQETAFFKPEIRVDRDGSARIVFTSPEALTKWKLQLLAHTPELAYAYESKEVVTQKELMILPNAKPASA